MAHLSPIALIHPWILGQPIHVLVHTGRLGVSTLTLFSSGFIGHNFGNSKVQRDMAPVIHGRQQSQQPSHTDRIQG